jgi:hypothetical protein
MAGKFTVVGASLGLDACLGRATVTSRTVYLALLTAAPTVASTLSSLAEYSATGYGRQACAMSAPSGTPRVSTNTALLTYGPLSGATGLVTITHWALVSASSGTTGDVVAYGDFNTVRTPAAGETATVAVGAVSVGLD